MKRLLLLLALPVLLSACYARGGYVAVATAPPPPRAVVVDPRPGYIWVDGHWVWNGATWGWNDGYWEADRPGYVWIGGNWVVQPSLAPRLLAPAGSRQRGRPEPAA